MIPSTSKTSPEKNNPGQIKLSILLKLTSLIFTPPEVTNSSPNGPLPEIIYLSFIRIFIILSLSSASKSAHFFSLSIPILFNKKIHNLFVNSGTGLLLIRFTLPLFNLKYLTFSFNSS